MGQDAPVMMTPNRIAVATLRGDERGMPPSRIRGSKPWPRGTRNDTQEYVSVGGWQR
jgi:hypothetical protein